MLTLINLYLIFFKLGLFSFGGGYVMLPLIKQQIEETGIIPIAEFPDILALSQMTPGPIAVNAATYIGYRAAGVLGAVVATLAVLTPAALLIMLLLSVINRYKGSLLVKAILDGVRPVTVGMIFVAVVYFLEITVFEGEILTGDFLKMGWDYINLLPGLLFLIVLVLFVRTNINPIILTVSAGVAGMLLF